MARKLGRRTDQRMHMLRNQVSELLWYGKIETTIDRAKEVRSIAEKLVTIAMNSYDDTVVTTKTKVNAKGEKVNVEFTNDGPKKLIVRRKLMANLRDLQEIKKEDETKTVFKERTREINHPLVEKMFNDYAKKYDARRKELGQGGGYTRIVRTDVRRGDNAQMAIIQMI